MKSLVFMNSSQPQTAVEPSQRPVSGVPGLYPPATRHLQSRVVIPIAGLKMSRPPLRSVPPASLSISASRRARLWELNATLHCLSLIHISEPTRPY